MIRSTPGGGLALRELVQRPIVPIMWNSSSSNLKLRPNSGIDDKKESDIDYELYDDD